MMEDHGSLSFPEDYLCPGVSQAVLVVKNLPASAGDVKKKSGFDPWVEKIPWMTAWQPTPVFLPGECPWTEEAGRLPFMGLQRVGHKKQLSMHTHASVLMPQ